MSKLLIVTMNPAIICTLICSVLLAQPAGGEERASERPVNTLTVMDVLNDARKLEIGDVISIRVQEDRREALQQHVAVTGEIQAPYLGIIKAEGLTCRALARQIKARLEKNFFKEATVIVSYEDPNLMSQPLIIPNCPLEFVVAFGALARQGKHDVTYDLTVSGLLLNAGGYTGKNAVPRICVIRKTPQGNKRILVNTKAILIEKRSEYDLFLRPNDVVIVK